MDRTRSIARLVSIVGHPFVLLPISIGWVTSRTLPVDQALSTMGIIMAWFVLFGVYVVIQVRRGVWTDIDVSKREQRPHMYLLIVPLGAATVLVLWWRDYPAPVLIGMGSAVAMLAIASIINRWIKVSLHSAFAVFAVTIPIPFLGSIALGLLLIPLCVAWGRVAMGRHTTPEVIVGLVCGAFASLPILLQPSLP